jgi:hypothetical protein
MTFMKVPGFPKIFPQQTVMKQPVLKEMAETWTNQVSSGPLGPRSGDSND